MSADQVKTFVDKFVEEPQWGIFGEARVNVLRLNLALDDMDTKKAEGTGAVKG
jgi:K+-transporting ATPase ATPase C chain